MRYIIGELNMRCKKCLTIFQGDVCPRCGLSVLKDAGFGTKNGDIDELEAAFLGDFKEEIEENKKNKKEKKASDPAEKEAAGSSSDAVKTASKTGAKEGTSGASEGAAGASKKGQNPVKTEGKNGPKKGEKDASSGKGKTSKSASESTGADPQISVKKSTKTAPGTTKKSGEKVTSSTGKIEPVKTEKKQSIPSGKTSETGRLYDDQAAYLEPDPAVIEGKTKELKPLWERENGNPGRPKRSHKRPERMPFWKVLAFGAAGLLVVAGAVGAMSLAGKNHKNNQIEAATGYPEGSVIYLDKQGNLKKKDLRKVSEEETILDKAVSSVVSMDEQSGRIIYLAGDALWYYEPSIGSVKVDTDVLSYNVSYDEKMNALIYTRSNALDLTYDAYLWTPDRGEDGALCLEKGVPYVEHFRFSEDGSTVAYSVRTTEGTYQIKRIKTFTNVPAVMIEGDDHLITYDLMEDGRVLYYDYSNLTLGISDGKDSKALARQSVADLYVDETRMIAVYLTEDGDACSVNYGASKPQAVKLSYDIYAAAEAATKEAAKAVGANDKKEVVQPSGDADKVDEFQTMTVVSETPQVYRATAVGSEEMNKPDEKYLILTKEENKNNESYMISFSELADRKTCLSYLGKGIWYSPQICSGDLSVIMDGKVVIYPGLIWKADPILTPEEVAEMADGRDSRVFCRTYQAVGETLAAGYDDLENLYGIITNDTEATSSILLRNVSWYETDDGWIYCLTTDGSLYLINGKDLVADPKVKVKTEKLVTSVSQVISLPQS